MRPWIANLVGLAIGFALGGAALLYFLPELQAMRQVRPWEAPLSPPPPVSGIGKPPAATPAPAPLPLVADRDLPRWNTRPAPADRPALDPVLSPAPLPEIVLPHVVHPNDPPDGVGTSGTGFFIGTDGTLLTAAHVVHRCRRTQIVSSFVRLVAASILATDTGNDIALLQVAHLRPPAVLALGRPARTVERLFVLGYPATAGRLAPEETWATLENAHLPAGVGAFADPRLLIWIQAAAVTHGYSGGPILDPANGAVVGLIKGMVDGERLREVPGMPTTGVAIGPGSTRLLDLVQREVPDLDVATADAWGDGAVERARRATVHVFCWH